MSRDQRPETRDGQIRSSIQAPRGLEHHPSEIHGKLQSCDILAGKKENSSRIKESDIRQERFDNK